ncbi:uncharacterized protein LOC115751270 isoform X2 [Rhodamnia argentea]|uniref:Uncharacterized protein LOC115751270 isoform X2 n=1 Tax=Rhodamnia argentea TaxID=178133 RepID=A0A8B8QCQ5_9MYRT|nr:uncharacterized protein LOC115751270 isoform X2 [Rhodamnia argentea]
MKLETEARKDPGRNPDPKPQPELDNVDDDRREEAQQLFFFDDGDDSNCSTPFVSAPSSPGRSSGPVAGYFYSAPASPMHFVLSASAMLAQPRASESSVSFEFEFSSRFGSSGSSHPRPMSSADELFLNGQIRPMKLSTHLERPQVLAPLLDLDDEEQEREESQNGGDFRGRDLRLRDKSVRRRTRSMSPLRNIPFEWNEEEEDSSGRGSKFGGKSGEKAGNLDEERGDASKVESLSSETTPSVSASSSRSSSAGRSSKRWVFLKDFLRSKSEGSSNNKFWNTLSFSPVKEKRDKERPANSASSSTSKQSKVPSLSSAFGVAGNFLDTEKIKKGGSGKKSGGKRPVNGSSAGKRRVPPSPHELHYTANRAQSEEMRKKTFLPYRQGLLGCLGFSSKGYGAMNGFARALNPVSSREEDMRQIII